MVTKATGKLYLQAHTLQAGQSNEALETGTDPQASTITAGI